MVIKYCFVPTCVNNSYKTQKKKFLSVPRDPDIRKIWALAVGRSTEHISTSGQLCCCEDHFDLKHDAENWMQYTMMSTKLRLKKNVTPHLNIDKKEVINTDSQISSSSRKMKEYNIQQFISSKKKPRFVDPEPSTTTTIYVTPTKNTEYPHHFWSPPGDFKVSGKPLSSSVGVQVNLKNKFRTVGVNTYIEQCSKGVQCNVPTTKNTEYSHHFWSPTGDFEASGKPLSASVGVQVKGKKKFRTVGVNTYIAQCTKAVQCNLIKYSTVGSSSSCTSSPSVSEVSTCSSKSSDTTYRELYVNQHMKIKYFPIFEVSKYVNNNQLT
ncbi:hypothetical protein CBL_11606 [Carabus blaptoides fortunei]